MTDRNARSLNVTLTSSPAGRTQGHRDCVRGLGLRRMHQTVTVPATPENLGMINRVSYLLAVEESS